MDDKALKRWQRLRDSCKDCFEKEETNSKGKIVYSKEKWCARLNKNCSFENCQDRHPHISYGNKKDGIEVIENSGLQGLKNLSDRQLEALKYSNQGKKSSEIAEKMNISRQAVDKLLFKAKAKIGVATEPSHIARSEKPHLIQLHNDNIAFEIYPINVTRIKGKLVRLKNVSYRQFTTEDYALKFYPQKLIIQFRKDIEGESVEKVREEADQRLNQFLSTFPFKGIQFRNKSEQLQRHYAILGTKLAKKYAKEGRKLLILDKWDGKQRITIDLSDGFHKPHFEALHPTKGEFDADRWHHLIEDATHNDVDLMSITKYKVENAINLATESMNLVGKFAEQQGAYAEEIKAHREAIAQMTKVMKEIEKFIKSNSKK